MEKDAKDTAMEVDATVSEVVDEIDESDMQNMVVKDDIDEAEADANESTEKKESAVPTNADNNIDNEDSLNLTIGEDEEKLLQDDVSSARVVYYLKFYF